MSCVEWAVTTRALRDRPESGDLHVVLEVPYGVLIAVIDGLGHGHDAAVAAEAAKAALLANDTASVVELFLRCHRAMAHTRGAAMTVAAIDATRATVTWAAVGNVEAVLLCAAPKTPIARRQHVLTRGGVVGYCLPEVRSATLPLATGDLLVFATDGVAIGFAADVTRASTPERIAAELFERYAKATDDALVLVARFIGLR